MTNRHVRLIGGSMTAFSLGLLFLIHATMSPARVEAAACCQTCEANEMACYAACDSSSHDSGDSVQECYDSCYYQLYEWTFGCWRHCQYCQQPPGSECWSCLVSEHGSQPGYHHVYYCWQTGGEWCA